MNPTPDRFRDESPTDYLRSLVEAMRRVVETSRDRMLAEMREAVETEAGQLDQARTERETSLRERAEADISAVGTWERAEIDRIKAEAQRKVQARSRQLDQELAQLAAATNAEHAALAARADGYEREVAAFMDGLEGIVDPATFASAARQMPSPSSGARVRAPMPATPEPASEAIPDAAVEPVAEPAAQPEPASFASEATPEVEPIAAESAPESAPEPAPAREPEAPTQLTPVAFEAPEPAPALPAALAPSTRPEIQPPAPAQPPAAEQDAPATPVASAATAADRNGDTASADAEQATAIQVRGLSSFGAITSFKQSLERVDGIHSVTLGLGPSGEFVYTATHAAAMDLDAAIRSIEGTAEIAREGETLRVKVGRRAG